MWFNCYNDESHATLFRVQTLLINNIYIIRCLGHTAIVLDNKHFETLIIIIYFNGLDISAFVLDYPQTVYGG